MSLVGRSQRDWILRNAWHVRLRIERTNLNIRSLQFFGRFSFPNSHL